MSHLVLMNPYPDSKIKLNLFPSTSHIKWSFLKTTDQRTTFTDHLPIDQLTTNQQTTDHMHQPPTNQPPTSKKFEGQKKFEFIFDINHVFKYRTFEIMLCIMYTNF